MAGSSFEGFDYGSDYHMTEKEQKRENWSQAKIWVVLGLFMGLCLAITIGMNVKEVILKNTGNSAVATYSENASGATLTDGSGRVYFVSLADTMLGTKSGSVRVYYYGDDMKSAKALTASWFWVAMYCVWTPLFAVCVRFAYKNITGDTKRARANKALSEESVTN